MSEILTEIIIICCTLLLITCGIAAIWRFSPAEPPRKKTVQTGETEASFASRSEVAKWKSDVETRMKALETQWDDTYAKMRRKEARYMRTEKVDAAKEEQQLEIAATQNPEMTAEELEKAYNRQKLGLA